MTITRRTKKETETTKKETETRCPKCNEKMIFIKADTIDYECWNCGTLITEDGDVLTSN